MRSYALPSSRAVNYPGFFQEIRQLLGEEATDKLVATYGGGAPVYIPSKIKVEHPLAVLLGLDAAQFLAGEYGGLSIGIPRNASLIREKRNILIKNDYSAGMSQGQLAMKYQITTRYIREIVNRDRP